MLNDVADSYASHPVKELNLPTRGANALRQAGITKIGQLLDMTVRDILNMREVGAGTLGGIVTAVDELDLLERVARLEKEVAELRALRWAT